MNFTDRRRWTLDRLKALHRVAKSKKHGLRPFFAHPKAMIELREEIARRETTTNVVPLHTRRAPTDFHDTRTRRVAAGGA